MKTASRAWRFSFRPLDERGRDAGLMVGMRGGIELVNEADAVRQALLLLISTRPGERVMRPDYGCHLFRLAFQPNDDTTAGLAIHYLRVAVERWEPRVVALKIDADRNREHKSRLDIHLQYRLRNRALNSQLELGFDLHAGRIF